MPPRPHAYQQVLAEHRRRLDRTLDRAGVARAKQLYDKLQDEATRKLQGLVGARDTFTAHVHRQVLAQVRQGQQLIGQRMAGDLTDLTHRAQVDSLRGLARDMNRLEAAFGGTDVVLPIEDAARFWGIVGQHSSKLRMMHEAGMRRWSLRRIGAMEEQLAVSLALQETGAEGIDRLRGVADMQWYQGERIYRTETAFASNATYHDGLTEAAAEIDDLEMRWCEHVDDFSGVALDDRVGDDSLVLHGQVTPVGSLFTMPVDPRVDDAMWLRTWSHPPNRPNDRAVLAPWKRSWGIPGWRFSDGKRVPIRLGGGGADRRRAA